MSTVTLTENHLDSAYSMGLRQAELEQLLRVAQPNLELDESDIADIVYRVTGYKLDIESEEAQELVIQYSEGYDAGWEVF